MKKFSQSSIQMNQEGTVLLRKIQRLERENKEFKNIDTKIAALSIMVNIESTIWFTLFDDFGISATKYMTTITEFILAGLTK